MKRKLSKRNLFAILIIFGFIIILTGFIGTLTINSVLWNNNSVRFTDSNGNSIFNKYYSGTQDKGAMIFHGFGEDMNSMRAIANDLVRSDFHVFSTDFSGHGRSSGTLDSENTTNDPLIEQVLTAKEKFKQISGLNDSEIILIGHSMGARAILQAVTEDENNISSIILIGGAVSIPENSTGSWIDDLGPDNPYCNVQIITGTWEDILPPIEAMKVYNKLANTSEVIIQGEIEYKTKTSFGFNIELLIFPRLLHSYEPLSPRVSKAVLDFCTWEGNEHVQEIITSFNQNRVIFLPFLFIGLYIVVIFGILFFSQRQNNELQLQETYQIEVLEPKKFLFFKPLIWIGAYIIGILFAVIIFLIPVGKPFFTFIYFIPFFGYGVIMLILNTIGKVPGMTGTWKPTKDDFIKKMATKQLIISISTFVILAFFSSFLINSSLYHVFPLNIRLLWFLIFSIFSFIGFFFILKDSEHLKRSKINSKKQILVNYLIIFTPFIVAVIFIGASGTLIYFPDGLHSLAIILFIILYGELVNSILQKPFYIALSQSFLLFLLLAPRGPMLLSSIF